MMNLCMVAATAKWIDGTPVGGHLNSMFALSEQLALRGHDVHVVVPRREEGGGELPTSQEPDGLTLHPIDLSMDVGFADQRLAENLGLRLTYGVRSFVVLVREALRLHRVQKFEVLHGHSGFPSVCVIPSTIGFRADDLATVHTLYCPVRRSIPRLLPYKLLFSRIDALVGISENVCRSIRQVSERSEPVVIPPLVDGTYLAKGQGSEVTDGPSVLFVGNTNRNKGLDVLIAAFDRFVDDNPEARLYLALDVTAEAFEAEDSEIKRSIHRSGLANHVVPVGVVDDLPALLRSVDMFVTPFRNTQGPADYPISLLEAMTTGTAVIATAVGGIPEIIDSGETGILCPPEDPASLADAMETLASDQAVRESLGQAARRSIIASNEGVMDRMESVYAEVSQKG